MTKYKPGDTVTLYGQHARVVWVSENANEIESMDEYILEFENKERRFLIASELETTLLRYPELRRMG
jgi:hypothetical protein